MANVFRSKEVYKHLKYDLHGKNEIVPVHGVYISGEYRPPYYNESGISIYEISSKNCNVVDFKIEEVDTARTKTAMMYKIGVSESVYNIQRYETESVSLKTIQTAGLYKLDVTKTSYNISRFEKDYINAPSTQTAGMYKIDISDSVYTKTVYGTNRDNSTPEPILRLTSFVSESCIITNYIS